MEVLRSWGMVKPAASPDSSLEEVTRFVILESPLIKALKSEIKD